MDEEWERVEDEGEYLCPQCGEGIVIPLDASAGAYQEYLEDCPVCCNPILVSVHFDRSGEASVTVRAE